MADTDHDVPTQRILAHITSLKQKGEKQQAEIVRLKSELAKTKSSNSRIKRIPKAGKVEDATPEDSS